MTTATTSAVAAPIATIFAINDGFVLPALEGLTHDELWKAPTDRNNAMLWTAGHVVHTRAMILQLLGEPVDTGWGQVFERGAPAATAADADPYPSRDEIERRCARSRHDCTRSWRRSTTRTWLDRRAPAGAQHEDYRRRTRVLCAARVVSRWPARVRAQRTRIPRTRRLRSDI
jgi:hypothetical protein